ncbi:hypothetical protein [Collimonas silvisoli]|uniref:hypothetical protein n=1 Tax=Collimonas silvisoli TaxID=2825884 RepID=UPI001B8B0BC9|nr:hypothetical protein [Collimonas silvisoli]
MQAFTCISSEKKLRYGVSRLNEWCSKIGNVMADAPLGLPSGRRMGGKRLGSCSMARP